MKDSKYYTFQRYLSPKSSKTSHSVSTQTIVFNQKQLSKNISSFPLKFKSDKSDDNINTIAKTSKVYQQLQKQLQEMVIEQKQSIQNMKQIDSAKTRIIRHCEQELDILDAQMQVITDRIQSTKQQLRYQFSENNFLQKKKREINQYVNRMQEQEGLPQRQTQYQIQNYQESEDQQDQSYFQNNDEEFQQEDYQYYHSNIDYDY